MEGTKTIQRTIGGMKLSEEVLLLSYNLLYSFLNQNFQQK